MTFLLRKLTMKILDGFLNWWQIWKRLRFLFLISCQSSTYVRFNAQIEFQILNGLKSVPSSFIYRSDVLGSYSSSPSSESASIKYIDEDITTVTDSTTFEHLETSAEIHPVPKAIEPGIILWILEVRNYFHVLKNGKDLCLFHKNYSCHLVC